MSGISVWKHYLELCKPRVVAEILFTAVVGMFLATDELPPLTLSLLSTLGITLAASSAAALNHVFDYHEDQQMKRTKNRPIARGDLQPRNGVIFAGVLGALSMLILAFGVNLLTAVLTFVSSIGYAMIYTLYLKRATPQNIVIGGLFGAMPPLLGWCAITGAIHPHALLLVLIVYVWTPPHFWALAIVKKEEYALVNIPMLPVTHGEAFTRLQILLYTILLVIASLLPYLTRMSHLIYLGAAVLLDIGFIYYALLMRRQTDNRTALKTFFYSIVYITLLFTALLIDHYIPVKLL